MLSSRADVGRWSRRRGLFLTPEETAPEPILQRLRALSSDAPPEAEPARGSALERVLADSALRELHLSLHAELETSDPLAEHVLAGLVLKCRVEGTSALTDDEQRTILRHGDALLALAADRQASALDDR
jgi:membrane glycosyltransferase